MTDLLQLSCPYQEIVQQVDICRINLTDKRFQVRGQAFDLSPLTRSIRQLGLIRLPVLWKYPGEDRGNEKYPFCVVTGFRRIQVLSQLPGTTKIWCRILPEPIQEPGCAILAVADNAMGSGLLPGEMVRALDLLARFYTHEQVAELSGALLGNDLNAFRIGELLGIARLAQPWADLLDAGKVTLRSVLQIASWDAQAQKNWYHVFAAVKVSSSKQGQMLDAFSEILAREKIDSCGFFSDVQVNQIMGHDTKDSGFKGEMLRQYLMTRRYPSLEAEKARVKALISELAMPKEIQLEIPENFESREYGVSLKFTSHDQLVRSVDQLRTLVSHPAWDGVLCRQG